MGGQESVVDALARQFTALGHEPVVLAPRPPRALQADDSSLPYAVVRHPRFISTHRCVDWYRWYLAKLYHKYRFDVLHCHSVYPTGYIAARCAATAGLPTVITSHCGDVCPTSRLFGKPNVPRRYVTALQSADALIAISEFVANRFEELCPHSDHIVRIPNGVDLERFSKPLQRPADIDPNIRCGEYFLFLGRLAHRKGVDLLLESFAQAEADNQLQVVIGGDGPERAALEAHAVALGIQRRVHFLGQVEGDRKTWLLRNSLCAVMPSRISEGFPLVLLESCAAGRPVIGTRIPGIQDMIESSGAGLLVPPDSTEDLSHALRLANSNRRLPNELGKQAQLFSQDYSWTQVADSHLELFDQLTTTRSRLIAA
jgi:glycosyltransferase involved in cell wall biosynthesis